MENHGTWEARITDRILRHRRWVLAAVAGLTVAAGVAATRVTFESDIEIWFLEQDPSLKAYREFLERFEADEITVIGLFAEDVFAPEVLAELARVTAAAEGAPWVLRATSLANVEIPNFTPIVVGIGFMAAVGIPLDPGTVMIGSIALGLVVDDTVHFLVRLRREVRAGQTLEAAVDAAVQIAGRPIIVTSLALIAGFLVLGLGSFTPNVDFGLMTACVVALALVADLVVLPAALVLVRPRL